jgi:hypothetical protein
MNISWKARSDRPFAHPRLDCDRVHRGADDAVARKQALCRGQDQLTVAGSVGALSHHSKDR